MEVFNDLIAQLGFPVACVVVLGMFINKLYEASVKREEKLYNEISETREINNKAIETIALYADRLQGIETNVDEIRDDITEIKEKI